MARRLAATAEVAGRADDPLAEVMLPDPVDHHPGRERVIGRAIQRASSSRPLPSVDPGRLLPAETSGKCRGTRAAGLRVAPPDVDSRVLEFRDTGRTATRRPGSPGQYDRGRTCALAASSLSGQLLELGPGLGGETATVVSILDPEGALDAGQLADEGIRPVRPLRLAFANRRAASSIAGRSPRRWPRPSPPAGGRPPASARRDGSRPCRRTATRRR